MPEDTGIGTIGGSGPGFTGRFLGTLRTLDSGRGRISDTWDTIEYTDNIFTGGYRNTHST